MRLFIPSILGVLLMCFLFSCQKEGSFELGQPSKGSLQSEVSGACLPKTVAGAFITEKALTDSNYIEMEVNVTSTGPYTIVTDTINGYFFRATGVFGQTGINRIKLKGYGKPYTAGTDHFVVFYDSSYCLQPVTVTETATPGNSTDLFPLSTNSWWSYIEPAFSSTDSIILRDVKTGQVAGKTYHFVRFEYEGEPLDTIYYRKAGNDYYEYINVDDYSLLSFDTEKKGELLFLKEGLQSDDTWYSSTFSGTIGGQAMHLRYKFTCTAANVTATVNGRTFNNVYKLSFKPQIGPTPSSFTDEGVTFEVYYAKGVGMIYFTDDEGGIISETVISRWKVL
jgi:hypothetical protein